MVKELICAALLTLAVGCATAPEGATGVVEVAPAVARSLDELPEPTEDVVVTLIARDGTRTDMDLAALDSLRQVRATVYEPFQESEVEFSGVAITDLLSLVGGGQASKLRVLALDDYRAEIPLQEAAAAHMFLATRQEGARIPLKRGGPTRLVFPKGHAIALNTDLWVWSVKDIVIQ